MLLLSSRFLRHAATAGEAHQKRRAEGLRAPWNGVPEVRLLLDLDHVVGPLINVNYFCRLTTTILAGRHQG